MILKDAIVWWCLNLIGINALRFCGALKEGETKLFESIDKSPNSHNIDLCLTLSDTLAYQGMFIIVLYIVCFCLLVVFYYCFFCVL